MDTSLLCRSCMKEVASWERENFDERIINMFTYCTNIQMPENDMLPKQFCYDCTIKIESSYTYVKEAQRINETLTNLLTQRTIIVEPVKHSEHTNYYKEVFDDDPIDTVVTNDEIVTNDGTVTSDGTVPNNETVNNGNITCLKDPVTTLVTENECKEKPVTDQRHVCSVCKKGFLSKVWYEKHIRNQHNGKLYSCKECPKTFQRPSQLSVHLITHSSERRHACGCGKRYKRRKELAAHARTHSPARPYQCDHCSMSFKLKSVLKSHMVVHQSEKPHLCYICGWSFKQAGNLAVHMRAHGGVKPHGCACGYRASTAAGLRRHEARHRAPAPAAHRCRACGKHFHDRSSLTRHSRSHTGARPYLCPGCPRAFADSWKRKLHLMRAHRVPLARIPRMRADPAVAV